MLNRKIVALFLISILTLQVFASPYRSWEDDDLIKPLKYFYNKIYINIRNFFFFFFFFFFFYFLYLNIILYTN